jgi:hypothetical protein
VDNDNIRFDLAGVEIAGVDCLAGVWHNYKLVINCETQSYDFYLDGKLERENIEFGFKTESVSRIVFRTGPYRNLVPNDYIDGYPNAVGMFGEDLPAAGRLMTLKQWAINLNSFLCEWRKQNAQTIIINNSDCTNRENKLLTAAREHKTLYSC